MIRFLVFSTILLLALPAHADISGFIVSVHDGDSITLATDDHHTIKIRAADIDEPELDQPFGDAATRAMDAVVYRKRVTITGEHPDQYGRTVGRTTITGGTVANVEMIRQGMASVYTRYSTDPSLPALETEARAAHRGLWHDGQPTEPWIWRRTHPPWAAPFMP
jgi:micrococcal nuclease